MQVLEIGFQLVFLYELVQVLQIIFQFGEISSNMAQI